MVIRRALATEYRERVSKDPSCRPICRTGDRSVIGGSDSDITFMAIGLSCACGVSSRLSYTHVIPAWRLETKYLTRLLYTMNYGLPGLQVLYGWKKAVEAQPESVVARVRRCLGLLRPQTAEGRCWMAFRKGYEDGLARRPFDERYR
jgi:hypothetical protein